MEFTAASSSSRLSREGEEEEGEEQEMDEEEERDEPSPREIPFMPPAASPPSVSPSAAAAASASASASGSPFRSSDGAGASGSGAGADVDAEPIDKEHMFDKVVTPSDVGKLNRLVIPKQHAEKYFPLDAAANDKGLLLSFEDRGGKLWRFRYSYWNSSQSYVMTKGWSRFVKEKRLDAGDTVSFSRGAADAARDRLFIDWKRRADPHARLARMPMPMPAASPYGPWGAGPGGFYMPSAPPATLYEHHRLRQGFDFRSSINAASTGPARPQVLYFGSPGLPPQHAHMLPPPQPQHPHPLHIAVQQPSPAVTLGVPMVLDSVPIASSPTAASKRVRLFGVNLDNPQPYGHGGESSQQDTNALSLRMPGWQRPAPYRLHEPPHHAPAGAESSAASSPSSSSSSKREAHSSLDLDL